MGNAPDKKLKLAIQFFGHLRTYKSCMPNLKRNLLDLYDCDVFMHTWSTLDHNTKTWHNYKPKKGEVAAAALERELETRLGNLKGLVVEKQEPRPLGEIVTRTHPTGKNRTMSVFGIVSMLHSMAEANGLREEYARRNNVQYDFVFCIRPDILLKKPLRMTELSRCLTPKQLQEGFFTLGKPLHPFVEGIGQMVMTDAFFCARPEVISGIIGNRQKIAAKFKDRMELNNAPEYEFIKTVRELGYKPYFTALQYGRDFEILRHGSSQNLRKRLVRMRLRKNSLYIYLLPGLAKQIIRVMTDVMGRFQIDFCIGNHNDDKL